MLPEKAAAYLALGGNIGDVRGTFSSACREISAWPATKLTAKSSLYLTKPWGVADQPDFFNACLAITTSLLPGEILKNILELERQHGRRREEQARWGPRTLDIDLLSYGDLIIESEELTLPHPQLFKRAFVLIPLAEIAGEQVISGQRLIDAAQKCDKSGITRLAEVF